ncbi:hypothetical protein OZK63_27155, partial [Streptomyces sp. UMAF16]|nr:hypothetical protein [Streptomyces sp. UMAF16]
MGYLVAVANGGWWVAVGGRDVLQVSSGGVESAVSVGVTDGAEGVKSGDRDGGSDTETPGAGVVVGVDVGAGAGLVAGRGGAAGRSSVGPCGHSTSTRPSPAPASTHPAARRAARAQ